ncbi:DNA primase [Breoghania sp.]|uniref:DNA primase n=1 Tax=Breoghania sp. TaxID=2065378 RepID=UPI00261CD394|nr:DNA primase [Breoghania sp.]MDJ0932592.1 DNA primase [Breoghania sp.]
MRFPPSLLDDIRARLPLSEVVAKRVTWDRRKTQASRGDYWACCPFHQEKTPSFHVDDRRGHYKCFGCGESGDHFKFLTETEGLSFPEAVEQLAQAAGVPLPKLDPRVEERHQRRADLAEVCEMAARFFERELYGPAGQAARTYLERRKLENDTLREFRFGLAPNGRDGLKRHLLERGVDKGTMVEAGLLILPDNGRSTYDRFRNRVMIPIQDERGQVVAFGGRTLDPDGQPKYLNSPETPLFHKGSMLFNLHRARQPAFEAGQAIVTEGYMDAIAVWQSGVRYVVASLGTAFTEDQIARMWRFAPEPIICFDGDLAGVNAANRAVDRILPALKSGYSFQFTYLPDGKDPDDLIKAGGRNGFLEEVQKALPLSEVMWRREVTDRDIATPERKAALEKSLYDLIAQIRDERVRRRYQLEIRLKLSNLFWEASRGERSGRSGQGRDGNGPSLPQRIEKPHGPLFSAERTICGLCTRYLDLFENNVERISRLRFNDDLHDGFKSELCRLAVYLDDKTVASIFETLDPRFYEILNEVLTDRGATPEAARFHPNWTKLSERLQVLNFNPPADFIERCFNLYLDELELGQLGREVEQEMEASMEDIDEQAWQRIQALKQEIMRRREELGRRDHDMAEEARGIRAAFKAEGMRKAG